MTDDPIAEAVERVLRSNGPCTPEGCPKPAECECRTITENTLTAALAPWGGLEAIRKLGEYAKMIDQDTDWWALQHARRGY